MIAELLYTRVERDFSPRGCAGWQCVQADGDCTKADLRRLVDASAMWEPGMNTVGNFRIEGERWLRVFVSPVDASDPHYREIVDTSNRGGIAIFHAFVYHRPGGVGSPEFPAPITTLQALVERIEELRGTASWDHRHPVLMGGM